MGRHNVSTLAYKCYVDDENKVKDVKHLTKNAHDPKGAFISCNIEISLSLNFIFI